MRRSLCFIAVALRPTAAFAPAAATSRFARRGLAVAAEGSVGRCEAKITEALSPASLMVGNNEDDPNGTHISIDVVAEAFEGLSRVKRQQLVMRSIKDELDSGAIHAIDSMKTRTPAEDSA